MWAAYDLFAGGQSQIISTTGLDPTVGLMKFEWVQPMDRPPFELNTHGGSLIRLAANTTQPHELTEWLHAMPSSALL